MEALKRIVGVCGILCEACPLFRRREDRCPGCVIYNEKARREGSEPCPLYNCAKDKRVGMCFYCDEFPCDLHYKCGVFSERILNMWKSLLKG